MMTNLLEIKNISKSFGDTIVLKDITFNVPTGAIVGFIGDNGAGKSTTFKTALGLVSKDAGTVKIFGKEDLNKDTKLKEQIGVVFDAMNLPAHLTIKHLNKIFGKLYNSWDKATFHRLINNFLLPTDQKINTFSRGMSMKLSVAVSLSHNAKLLFLDEATGGLDPSSREEVLNELKKFVDNSKGGILLSSHIMSDVEKIASHLVVIKDGKILLNEEKKKVFEYYALVDTNKINLLPESLIVAKRKYESCMRVLVSDKTKLPEGMVAKNINMDELSVFLTGSEN